MNLATLTTEQLVDRLEEITVEIDRRRRNALAELSLLKKRSNPAASSFRADDSATVANTIHLVAEAFAVKFPDLVGPTRTADVVKARHAVWLILRNHKVPVTKIAEAFKCDHSSISHGYKRAEQFCQTDAEYALLIDEIQTKLNS